MQYDGATGWLVGEPHKGMAAMFTMMNNARLGVGVQGVGVAEAALQQALAYAQDRKQGKTPLGARRDHRPCRCAPDAGGDEGRDLCRPRHRAGLRRGHRHGPRHRARPNGRRAPRC